MATLTAQAKEKRAGVAGLAHHAQGLLKSISRRTCRNKNWLGNELRPVERPLRGSSSRWPGSDPLAATRPIAPSYSRRVALLKFDVSLPSRRMTVLGSTTQLGERVLRTRSSFPGTFSHTVVCTFGSVGALAGLFLISNPISTHLDASASVVKFTGASQ